MNERADLARKLELIGRFLMVDGLPELVGQYVEGMTIQKLNGITLQILAKGMAADKKLMDEMVAMHRECSIEEVQSMADGDYTKALRETIWSDVFGFFA